MESLSVSVAHVAIHCGSTPYNHCQMHKLFHRALGDDDRGLIDDILAHSEGPQGPVFGLERIKGERYAILMKTNLNQA